MLFCAYKDVGPGVPDRAQRRLFQSSTSKPSGSEYVTISQKLLSAAGARFVLFWMANLLASMLNLDPNNEFLQSLVLN